METLALSLPENWPRNVRSAVLHVASLTHWTIIYTRSLAADSKLQRVRLAAELERARNEISLLREEIRIKDARLAKISPHNRPFYPPTERMAILELKAARGWNLRQTAAAFLLEPETIAEWMKRVEDDSLIRTPQPVNTFPAFVRHIVKRLKTLCPAMGKQRIAETLAKAGLHLAASTVGRILTTPSFSPAPNNTGTQQQTTGTSSPQVVTAKYPNHVWHVDLTVVPTSTGFWTSWFPFTLPQVWPFCYWVAVVMDHFSRKVMGFAVFKKQPTSLDVRSFIGKAIGESKADTKHLISDRGTQFDCDAFRKWAKRKRIKLRYGAVGKYGSIAVIERFILSMKSEFTNRLLIPLNMDDFRHELGFYATWYNEYRPHQTLEGKTPQEAYSNDNPQALPSESIPNSRLPEMKLIVSQLNGNRFLPLVELKKAA